MSLCAVAFFAFGRLVSGAPVEIFDLRRARSIAPALRYPVALAIFRGEGWKWGKIFNCGRLAAGITRKCRYKLG